MPSEIGSVIAHFTAYEDVPETEKICSPVFDSGRVRSSLTALGLPRRGRKTSSVSLTPDDGWRFHTESSGPRARTLKFDKVFKECSNQSNASVTGFSESKYSVQIKTITKSNYGVNCITRTTLCAYQWKTKEELTRGTSSPHTLRSSSPLPIQINGNKVSLSHVEIFSQLLKDGSKVITTSDRKNSNFQVSYDPATQTALVSIEN